MVTMPTGTSTPLLKHSETLSNTVYKDSTKPIRMDPYYVALILFKNRKFDKCIDKCSELLSESPYDQAVWTLKMRAMTRKVKVDDIEMTVDGYDEYPSVWTESIATAPRPGTSLKHPLKIATALPRPGTGANRLTTARAINTGLARTAHTPGTARALLATAQARAQRLGTATMLLSAQSDSFVQGSKLNLIKYAQDANVGKALFEYLFYREGDYRHAMELAVHATKHCNFADWWWRVALAKCHNVYNLPRDAEEQLRAAVRQHIHVDTFVRLIRNYARLDQPTAGLEVCREGLRSFPDDVHLLTEQARLTEGVGDAQQSVRVYRAIAVKDAMNVEAIANIAVYHFYNDQPELALRYYRRILAMGIYSVEVFNNIGLCCLRAQHWDLILTCFKRALLLATETAELAEVWYNLSHLAVAMGDINLATQCLRLSINIKPSPDALNNLASLETYSGHNGVAKSLYLAALSLDPSLSEAIANVKRLDEEYNMT